MRDGGEEGGESSGGPFNRLDSSPVTTVYARN